MSIASVVDDPPEGIVQLLASWGAPAEAVMGEADETIEVERMQEVARSRGVPASGEVLRGKRASEVCRKVLREKPDLLVKAAEPTHAIHQVLLGHTDRQLIRRCPCAVWIEKPSDGRTHDRILAAVDPSPFRDDPVGDPVREELDTSILRYGQLLARVEEADLHVVHAWSFDLALPLRSRAGMPGEEIEAVAESLRQKHKLALSELLATCERPVAGVHLVRGHAGEEIARLAAGESIDVIVMGTLCRTGLEGLLIGNTAETVLDHADCSILALKPRAFVPPFEA